MRKIYLVHFSSAQHPTIPAFKKTHFNSLAYSPQKPFETILKIFSANFFRRPVAPITTNQKEKGYYNFLYG
jgi:hypothetical protein